MSHSTFKRKSATEILAMAEGRWPHLLGCLGGLRDDQLTNAHQPCPNCLGTDRYRWMKDDGPGGWWCSHCGGKNRQGGAGSGIDLLMRVRNWTFSEAVREIERYYDGLPFVVAPRKVPKPSQLSGPQKHSELEYFRLLDFAGQIADGEGFRPPNARNRDYSRRWAAFSATSHDAALSIALEFETIRGIESPPIFDDQADDTTEQDSHESPSCQ